MIISIQVSTTCLTNSSIGFVASFGAVQAQVYPISSLGRYGDCDPTKRPSSESFKLAYVPSYNGISSCRPNLVTIDANRVAFFVKALMYHHLGFLSWNYYECEDTRADPAYRIAQQRYHMSGFQRIKAVPCHRIEWQSQV